MKITFDTDDVVRDGHFGALGTMLRMMFERDGGHPYYGRDMTRPGWSLVAETPRPFAVALMGDDIYEGRTVTHIRHDATGLEALWYSDGTISLMFHMPVGENEAGFTIVNHRNGFHGMDWDAADLEDPRNDPDYDPFLGRRK